MAVNATAVWRVRPSGVNTNGGGYDPGISGAATDYSQQNSAQASGTHGTATGTTTFTDATALAFTSAMVGNAIYITGTGQTTGWYFVTAYSSSSVVTLDRSPGTGTLATWHLGGGWADFTNLVSTGPLVTGNTVYALGSGTPNPASYTYDYTVASTIAVGPNVAIATDPATPGYKAAPDTTGGMATIKFTTNIFSCAVDTNGIEFIGIWFVAATGVSAGNAVYSGATNSTYSGLFGCVLDQFGFDVCLITAAQGGNTQVVAIVGCEVFSSQGGTGGSYGGAYYCNTQGTPNTALIIGCNIHDCVGYGIFSSCTASFYFNMLTVTNTIVAKCSQSGIYSDGYQGRIIQNCTIDGNGVNGIDLGPLIGGLFQEDIILNNIISNHTAGGAYGLKAHKTSRSLLAIATNYNTFYNNTADIDCGYGPQDTYGGANPYVNQATENYAININFLTPANAFPGIQFPNKGSGQSRPENYLYPGACQPQVLPFPQTLV